MLKKILVSALFLASMNTCLIAQPQESAAKKQEAPAAAPAQNDARFFRLDFIVRELDGKRTISSRNYSTTIEANGRFHGAASIRTGNRVPIPATSKDAQFTYSDIGVNIDCTEAGTVGSELSMFLTAEISSLSDTPPGSQSTPPILRSTRWRSATLVAVGKPTIVFTAEDEHTGHVLELELTATLLH